MLLQNTGLLGGILAVTCIFMLCDYLLLPAGDATAAAHIQDEFSSPEIAFDANLLLSAAEPSSLGWHLKQRACGRLRGLPVPPQRGTSAGSGVVGKPASLAARFTTQRVGGKGRGS